MELNFTEEERDLVKGALADPEYEDEVIQKLQIFDRIQKKLQAANIPNFPGYLS